MSTALVLLATLLAAEPEAPQPPAPPKEISAGLSSLIRPYLLAQVWGFVDHSTPKGCVASDCMATSATFRIRRAEMGVYGSAFENRLQYKAVIDPMRALEFKDLTLTLAGPDGSTQDTTIKQPNGATTLLQDLYMTYAFEWAEITAGQFRVPLSWESVASSSKLLLPERALVVRQYADKRDIGLRVSKGFKYFGYSVALLNGAGQNVLDNNNHKDLVVRLEAYPVSGLLLGLVAYESIGGRGEAGAKDRWEGDLRFEKGPFIGQAEFIRARDRSATGWTDSYGFYVAGAFTFLERFQAAIRYGHYDPKLGQASQGCTTTTSAAASCEANVYEAGLNAFVHKNEVKLQLGYSLFDWAGLPAQHQVIVVSQFTY